MTPHKTLVQQLNHQQLACVCAPEQHVLVVAGAGSGKTTVLVGRIHHYLCKLGLQPAQILALTFTHRAAEEIRERAARLANCDMHPAWLTTFHAACARLLRSYGRLAANSEDFLIIDTRHQRELLRRIIDEQCPVPSHAPPLKLAAELASLINQLKEQGVRAAASKAYLHDHPSLAAHLAAQLSTDQVLCIYGHYEERLKAEHVCDFAELVLRTCEYMEQYPAFREQVQRRFRAVLVDEFQDTNALQYRLLSALCAADTQLFIVGDDDQSIYGFRGAMPHNMQRLGETFTRLSIYKLDINYRSSQAILDVANALIAQNSGRLVDKHLQTTRGRGQLVSLVRCSSDDQEHMEIAHRIAYLVQQGASCGEIAVLYRNNFLSARIEEALRSSYIDYEVVGAQKFFEREEIQNALSYLRLAVNPDDDTSFCRIANVPPRRIGAKTLAALSSRAHTRHQSLLRTVLDLAAQQRAGQRLNKAASALLTRFGALAELMTSLTKQLEQQPLAATMEHLLELSGLSAYYAERDHRERRPEYLSRYSNLSELLIMCRSHDEQYARLNNDERREYGSCSQAFLARQTLDSNSISGTASAADPAQLRTKVQLMTIHAAKGLEFQYVLVADFDEGIIPSHHALGIADPQLQLCALEEERRLAYVAITRARAGLWIYYTMQRRSFTGMQGPSGPSAFLRELTAYYAGQQPQQRPYVIERLDVS